MPSANQALSDLEQATGKPVLVMEAPDVQVLATICRASPGEASHLLPIQGSSSAAADYLIAFQRRLGLREGAGPRAVPSDNPAMRAEVISACEQLHRQLPQAKARELGSFIYGGLLLQLRSMGPGMLVDRWIRQHCPALQEAQAGQVPASATIAEHLNAGRYDEAIPLQRTRLQREPDHVESLYNLDIV